VQNIREKYPQRLPVLCNKSKYSKNTPNIDKNKYLVPFDLTAAQFIYVIRKRMKLNPEVALFLFVGRMIPPGMTKMIYLYENYKNEDGFLYITYSTESTFGLL
jgi:GABA(A) receptor-associated protein